MIPLLRAIVADDSALYRRVVARCLTSLGGVEIVGEASNGKEAIELASRCSPDLLTLDMNMPILDGLGTLRALRAAHLTCEVIVVSAETRQGAAATLDALQLGAVDFITKPATEDARISMDLLTYELRRQLSAIRMRRDHRQRGAVSVDTHRRFSAAAPIGSAIHPVPEVVVIGTSTGGPAALPVLLGALPASFGVPVLVVQHMPPLFTASLAESLDRKCGLRVVEAHHGQLAAPGHAYIAPGGRHMKTQRAFDKAVRIMLTDEPPENHCRPSVDTLFRSVAQTYEGRVVAAILTGMGNDGVAGLRVLKGLGAMIIAQDEATSTVFGMPQEAIRAAVVDVILPLERIGPQILVSLSPNGK
ncbi:MAG TPA: chemotaxis response regulator protein-glutamate methylesterase [Polyangiaceae bacterium]